MARLICWALPFSFILNGIKSLHGKDVIFNVSEKVNKNIDSLTISCLINSTMEVDTFYFMELFKFNAEIKIESILIIRPHAGILSLEWRNNSIAQRAITNSSMTLNGIIYFTIPAEIVEFNDSGIYKCSAKWLTLQPKPISPVDSVSGTETRPSVEPSTLTPTSTTTEVTTSLLNDTTSTIDSISTMLTAGIPNVQGEENGSDTVKIGCIIGITAFVCMIIIVIAVFCENKSQSSQDNQQ